MTRERDVKYFSFLLPLPRIVRDNYVWGYEEIQPAVFALKRSAFAL